MGGGDLFQRGDPPGWGLAGGVGMKSPDCAVPGDAGNAVAAAVGDDNPMTAGREADSGGATDAAGGTGDQGSAVEGGGLLLRVVVMPRR